MNVLIVGLNYAPEPVGIGPYTAGMAASLVRAGHEVTVICAKPYYPQWQVAATDRGLRARRSEEAGVRIVRVPIYVPAVPSGARRVLHHLSFALSALPAVLAAATRRRPDVVIAIAPSLISTAIARIAARLTGAKLWLHVQDFEVAAAGAVGLLRKPWLMRLARAFEGWSLRADRVSTISPQMCDGLAKRGIAPRRIVEFRNWATLDRSASSEVHDYRLEWGIDRPHVAIYSGSIANKQGLDLILEAARRLSHRRDLVFVVCGNGPQRERLITAAAGLDNIQFRDLQPAARLGELLALASVHLLPQVADAADLLLPSKLTNMLQSGRPVVATAVHGTALAHEVEGCGMVVPPGDGHAFAAAIERLIDHPELAATLGAQGRQRAQERWSAPQILGRFERQLCELAA
ncbi:colanic acid biosynthesis glycosyl transferase WcaI [Novosphingobium chloroacetimidivorans]|uniref:Colanic acid biosynthesis glycosyl transferase WcaI n=1 Tax=Novosphingobium chloroacetimidivorans TaxID=1428314 RepID=A0A7W7K8X4_9SPHN|nr:WcaI family glycosyltransferase [Novosphingobium chloroacetimidivorans]MBB4858106.1 colanic acid biosynthesis glycosyl transferase WcaI [Novosphingobium chloroacetimidivorans]